MAVYAVYANTGEAEARSAQEAEARGCTEGTLYWWQTQTAADAVHGLLVIGADAEGSFDTGTLTAAEQSQVLTEAQAVAGGLLAPIPNVAQ